MPLLPSKTGGETAGLDVESSIASALWTQAQSAVYKAASSGMQSEWTGRGAEHIMVTGFLSPADFPRLAPPGCCTKGRVSGMRSRPSLHCLPDDPGLRC